MAHLLVEGDWKNYSFKLITKEDYPSVLEHLRENFHRDEPLSKIVGNSEAQFRDVDKFTAGVLDDGLSIGAFSKATGKVAGVRVTGRSEKGVKDEFTFESIEFKTVIQFLTAAESGLDIYERFAVDEYADLFMASVDREFRGDGLATELYKRTLAYLRERGFKLAKSSFTSPITRKIAEKYAFQEIARKYFRELQNPQGEFLCPDLGDEDFVAIRVLQL